MKDTDPSEEDYFREPSEEYNEKVNQLQELLRELGFSDLVIFFGLDVEEDEVEDAIILSRIGSATLWVEPDGMRRPQLTKRVLEIAAEILARASSDIIQLAIRDVHPNDVTPAEVGAISKFRADYLKAYYGPTPGGRNPETWRAAVDFVRGGRYAGIRERERGHAESDRKWIARLKPVRDALTGEFPNCEFLDCVLEAARMLDSRLRSWPKGAKIGSGDVYLEKWLLEYGLTVPQSGQHTVRELNEQFVSKFRTISDDKLREKCRVLEVPLKPDFRGKAAPRYGRGL